MSSKILAPTCHFNELKRGVRDLGYSDVMYQKIENDDYGGGDIGDGNEDGSVNAWVS